MVLRKLARMVASVLLAAGVIGLAAAPAQAAAVDLGVDLKGTTIDITANRKSVSIRITNLGATRPERVGVRLDFRAVSPAVELVASAAGDDCEIRDRVAECQLVSRYVPAPGQTVDALVPVRVGDRRSGGNQGRLVVTVIAAGDADLANNSRSAEVATAARGGQDLVVVGDDVTAAGTPDRPVRPGDRTKATGYVVNNGGNAATDLTYSVRLPPHLTFAAKEKGCAYNAAMTEVRCAPKGLTLLPETVDPAKSALEVSFDVVLDRKAKGPAAIGGGVWSASSRPVVQAPPGTGGLESIPDYSKLLPPEDLKKMNADVDESDNSDGFAVLVAAPSAASGGGTAGGGAPVAGSGGSATGDSAAGSPGRGDGGSALPVTGPVVATVAGAGALAALIGAFLVVSARRRRPTLVTPDDEKWPVGTARPLGRSPRAMAIDDTQYPRRAR